MQFKPTDTIQSVYFTADFDDGDGQFKPGWCIEATDDSSGHPRTAACYDSQLDFDAKAFLDESGLDAIDDAWLSYGILMVAPDARIDDILTLLDKTYEDLVDEYEHEARQQKIWG